MVIINTASEQELLRENGRIVALVHSELKKLIQPGITTMLLEKVAEEIIYNEGAIPVFKGYKGYNFCTCISVNEEIVHGKPSDKRVLKEGDIVSVDVGTYKWGYSGDACFTAAVGKISEEATKLIDTIWGALNGAVSIIKEGTTTGMLGNFINTYATSRGYGVVKEYIGHGIGKSLHMDPAIPNYGRDIDGIRLKAGMCICVEPLLCVGNSDNKTLNNGWTAVTKDESLAAHVEHQVIVHKNYGEVISI